MPDPIDLLRRRRSVKPNELRPPGPTPAELEMLLTIASRVPDHGKLTPWRFVVFAGDARQNAGEAIAAAFVAKYPDAKPEHIAYERLRLARLNGFENIRIAPALGGRVFEVDCVRRRDRG